MAGVLDCARVSAVGTIASAGSASAADKKRRRLNICMTPLNASSTTNHYPSSVYQFADDAGDSSGKRPFVSLPMCGDWRRCPARGKSIRLWNHNPKDRMPVDVLQRQIHQMSVRI